MPWLGGIGAAVAAFVGISVAAASVTAVVIGGIVVGAAVGGLYAAVTGGDILKGVLYGAVGGAVVGFGGVALGFAGPVTAAGGAGFAPTTAGGLTGSLATEAEVAGAVGTATTEVSVTGGILGGAPAAGGSLFTTEGLMMTQAVGSLGSAFLQAVAMGDAAEGQIASNEKMQSERLAADKELAEAGNATQLQAAEIARAAGDARNKSAEKMAAADLDFNKNKFSQEFTEDQWRDRTDREEKATAKQQFQSGLEQASQYVAGNTQTVGLVESSRRRKALPSPAWYAQSAKPAAQGAPPVAQPAQPQAVA